MREISGSNLELHRMDGGIPNLFCQDCILLDLCGGNNRVGGGWCEGRCNNCTHDCDLICLRKPEVLAEAVIEVGGFDFEDISQLNVPSEIFPHYLPLIQNGSSRKRALRSDWAAIPLSGILKHPKGMPVPVALSSDEIRAKFKLRASTKLLLVGVGKDDVIERYWGDRNDEIFAAIAKMGFSGAIVPNYSISLNHPRPQHLYNRKRSLVCAREWSARGIPVIPYLQAVAPRDWLFWREFLEVHEEVAMIAKEFQTGNSNPVRGRTTLHELAHLQDILKRPLHVVAVGAAQFRGEIARLFSDWTICDSMPFMKALKRKRAHLAGRRIKWSTAGSQNGRLIDGLLSHDVAVYREWMNKPFVPPQPFSSAPKPAQVSLRQLKISL